MKTLSDTVLYVHDLAHKALDVAGGESLVNDLKSHKVGQIVSVHVSDESVDYQLVGKEWVALPPF